MTSLLYIHWNVDPIFLHLGPLQIRWYGLFFMSGFVIGWYLFKWFFTREKIDTRLMDPLLFTLLVATVVGARLGHCIFYQPDYYFGSWKGVLEIFQVWKGGLASHGGAIALLLAMWWFAAKYGKAEEFDFLWIMDRLCIAVAFAGCMIRLGNLFNSEIYGSITNLPWGFVFEKNAYDAAGNLIYADELLPHHPTQLYEALSYLILGLVLVWIYKSRLDKVHRGFFFGLFLLGCFGMRFLIEFVKNPQVDFEEGMALDMGQILSIPFILAGICLLVFAARKRIPAAAVHEKPAKKKEATHVAHGLYD